jgi:hypothetical protein
MESIDRNFERRARWMYELGRLRRSARMLALVIPILGWAWLIRRPASLVALAGGLLVVLAVGSAFVHLRRERAAVRGIAAGLPALLLPWTMKSLGLLRIGGTIFDPCIPSCVLVGAIAGAFVAVRATGVRHSSIWLNSAAVACLTGVLGCSVAGAGGIIGLAIGVALGAAPVLVRTELRQS